MQHVQTQKCKTQNTYYNFDMIKCSTDSSQSRCNNIKDSIYERQKGQETWFPPMSTELLDNSCSIQGVCSLSWLFYSNRVTIEECPPVALLQHLPKKFNMYMILGFVIHLITRGLKNGKGFFCSIALSSWFDTICLEFFNFIGFTILHIQLISILAQQNKITLTSPKFCAFTFHCLLLCIHFYCNFVQLFLWKIRESSHSFCMLCMSANTRRLSK